MKLVVQVPCLNEEDTLPAVLGSIPRRIAGIDEIEILVIDDGSTDRTVEVARAVRRSRHQARQDHGPGAVLPRRRRLRPPAGARTSWSTPTATTSTRKVHPRSGASDPGGSADIVISDRQTDKIEHFSPFKKRMQRFGSEVVNKAARTDLPDAASGFRAYSRASLFRLNVVTQFSYCMETIIQAGNAAADRQRPHRDQPEDPRIAAFQEHLAPHVQVGGGDHPQLPDVSSLYPVGHTGHHLRCPRTGSRPAVRCAVAVRRGQRPHPVADLRHVDVRRVTAVFRAADHRRPVADEPDHARGEPGTH